MINELKNMLFEKLIPKETVYSQNVELEEELQVVKKQREELYAKLNEAREQLNTALDEIVLNQTRINALLKQLADKNGGRNV